MTPPSEGNTHSTSTSTSSPTVPEIRAPGKQERRTSRVFPDSKYLRRSLKARRIMLQWKVILNLQWRHEATLCDNKNHPPKAYPVKAVPSKPSMTQISTENRQWHVCMLRDPVGAVHWQTILDQLEGVDQIIGYSVEGWKRCPEHGSDKIRFECSINNMGNLQYGRAIQGHSG